MNIWNNMYTHIAYQREYNNKRVININFSKRRKMLKPMRGVKAHSTGISIVKKYFESTKKIQFKVIFMIY